MDIESLIRPNIADGSYTPICRLSSLGKVGARSKDIISRRQRILVTRRVSNLQSLIINILHLPRPESTQLRAALSRDLNLPAENILAGAGADDRRSRLAPLHQPDDSVIDCPPTFGMYSFDTAVNAGR